MTQKTLGLQFPLGGVDRKRAYRKQPPFTSPDMLNVRGDDTIVDRARGGQRPGLVKEYYEQLGSGNPVNMLDSVTTVATADGHIFRFTDTFDRGAIGSGYTASSWLNDNPEVTRQLGGTYSATGSVGAVHDAFDLDTSSVYQVMLRIVPYQGEHRGTYNVFFRMDDTTTVATTDGAVASLTLDGTGTYSGTLDVYVAGVKSSYSFSGGADTVALPGWFRVNVNGDVVNCYWLGHRVLTNQTISAAAGDRIGFGIDPEVGGLGLVDTFYVNGTSSDPKPNQSFNYYTACASNGTVYSDQVKGVLSSASGASVASGYPLQTTERAQKLYIADHAVDAAYGIDGIIAGNTLTSASVADWTALGISTTDHVCELSNGTGANDAVYSITTINVGSLVLSAAPGDGGATFRVARSLKTFDPTANATSLVTASYDATVGDEGNVPVGCSLVALYRDRIVLSGNAHEPNLWYMSKAGDPTDWNIAPSVVTSTDAVTGQTADQAGEIGFPITALCPYRDDFLVMGGQYGLSVLNGDPMIGGYIRVLSEEVGIVSGNAWCFGHAGEMYFLSTDDGLYMLPPGGNDMPKPMSRELIPDELIGIDITKFYPRLVWDMEDRGVHIYVTSINEDETRHWFWAIDQKGFFEDSYIDDHQCTSAARTDGRLLVGCKDGYIRIYDENSETDDGTNIESYADIGPLRLGGNDYVDGILSQLEAAVSKGSGDIDWSIRVADTHEATEDASTFTSGTWTGDGLQYREDPRARGGSMVLRVGNSGDRSWSLEKVVAVVEDGGRVRKG